LVGAESLQEVLESDELRQMPMVGPEGMLGMRWKLRMFELLGERVYGEEAD
jgi:hypothetical protein